MSLAAVSARKRYGFVPTPPTQASTNGFNTLVFSDDFNVAGTIATTGGASNGFKWYWSPSVGSNITSGSWTLNTSGTATGTGASPVGGVLQLNSIFTGSPVFYGNSTLISIPRGITSVPANTAWQHCYVEFYAQLPSTLSSPTGLQSGGWPALWSWTAEGANSFWGGQFTSMTATSTEIDFFEAMAGVFSNPAGYQAANIFYPGGTLPVRNTVNITPVLTNNNWHTWGMLWTGASAGGGFSANSVYIYYDNVQKAGPWATSGTTLETSHIFLIMGTGTAWPLYVDWVRVWQAP